ncbi:hypothetical protein [Laspinema palackyanum]
MSATDTGAVEVLGSEVAGASVGGAIAPLGVICAVCSSELKNQ